MNFKNIFLRSTQPFLLPLLVILFLGKSEAQTTVQIGNGTISYPIGPIFFQNGYSIYNQPSSSRFIYIYSAEELSQVGILPGASITKFEWSKLDSIHFLPGISTTGIFNIYLKNICNDQLELDTTYDWQTERAGSTLVHNVGYNSANDFPNVAGWVSFNFSTPFVYDGGSLEIFSEWDASALPQVSFVGSNSPNWASTFFGYQTRTLPTSMNTALPLTNSFSTFWGGLTFGNTKPNIKITYTNGTCSGVVSPGIPVICHPKVCGGYGEEITLNGVSQGNNLIYQWQNSLTGLSGTFSNIAGNDSAFYTVNGITDQYYRCVVTCPTSGSTDSSSSLFVNIDTATNCYCQALGGVGYPMGIGNIKILQYGNILFSNGTADTTFLDDSSYNNFTSIPAPTLFSSQLYKFRMTAELGPQNVGAPWYYITVFIDYNHDGTFQLNERTIDTGAFYFSGPPPWQNNIWDSGVANFIIPSNITPGLTRMRVIGGNNGGIIYPCGGFSHSEVEDYTVNLEPPPCPTALMQLQPYTDCHPDTINVINISTGTSFVMTVTGPGVNIISNSSTLDTIYIPIASGGNYFVQVISNCGGLSDTVSNFFVAHMPPTACLTDSYTCVGNQIKFSDTCSHAGSLPIINYHIHMPGADNFLGTSSNNILLSSSQTTGSGFASLIVYDQFCSDTTVIPVYFSSTQISNSNINLNQCYGDCDTVSLLTNAPAPLTWQWNSPMYLSCDSCTQSIICADTSINYSIILTSATGCMDTANVNVNVAHNFISINSTADTICKGDTLFVYASGAIIYNWFPVIMFGSNPFYAAPQSTTTFTVIGQNANGCVDTNSITIVVDSCNSGIQELNKNSISIYPNPSNDFIFIESKNEKINSVKLFNVVGKEILNEENSSSKISLHVSQLPAGIYFAEISVGKNIFRRKIFIAR